MSQGCGIREVLIVISHLDDVTPPRHHGCGIEMILRIARVRISDISLYAVLEYTIRLYRNAVRLPCSSTTTPKPNLAQQHSLCGARVLVCSQARSGGAERETAPGERRVRQHVPRPANERKSPSTGTPGATCSGWSCVGDALRRATRAAGRGRHTVVSQRPSPRTSAG
jgi:hypothetical protein